MKVRDLRPLAVPLIMLAAINALWVPVIFGWAGLWPDHFNRHISPIATTVDDCKTVLSLIVMLLFIAWLYQAGRNLVAIGHDDLDFTPASRIWWFAVPVASLFKPFQGMRELWNVSHGIAPRDRDHTLLYIWWALRLLNGFVAMAFALGSDAAFESGGVWVTGALDIAAAIPSIMVVIGITRVQVHFDHPALAEEFA